MISSRRFRIGLPFDCFIFPCTDFCLAFRFLFKITDNRCRSSTYPSTFFSSLLPPVECGEERTDDFITHHHRLNCLTVLLLLWSRVRQAIFHCLSSMVWKVWKWLIRLLLDTTKEYLSLFLLSSRSICLKTCQAMITTVSHAYSNLSPADRNRRRKNRSWRPWTHWHWLGLRIANLSK